MFTRNISIFFSQRLASQFIRQFTKTILTASQTWPCWLFVALISVMSISSGLYLLLGKIHKINVLTKELKEINTKQPLYLKVDSNNIDFTSDLPDQRLTNILIRDTFFFAKKNSVAVISVEPLKNNSFEGSFKNSDFFILKVRGTYPAMKSLIADMLSNHSGLVLSEVKIRRGADAGGQSHLSSDVVSQQDGDITFIQWYRPVVSPERAEN